MKNVVVKIGLEKIKKYKNKNENKYNVMRMKVNKKIRKIKKYIYHMMVKSIYYRHEKWCRRDWR